MSLLMQRCGTRSLARVSALHKSRGWALRPFSNTKPGFAGVEAPDHLDAGERKVFDLLKDGLEPVTLEVQDVSGGCGSMYAVDVASSKFANMPLIQQHRLVKKVLGEEFKKWHGIQLKTRAS